MGFLGRAYQRSRQVAEGGVESIGSQLEATSEVLQMGANVIGASGHLVYGAVQAPVRHFVANTEEALGAGEIFAGEVLVGAAPTLGYGGDTGEALVARGEENIASGEARHDKAGEVWDDQIQAVEAYGDENKRDYADWQDAQERGALGLMSGVLAVGDYGEGAEARQADIDARQLELRTENPKSGIEKRDVWNLSGVLPLAAVGATILKGALLGTKLVGPAPPQGPIPGASDAAGGGWYPGMPDPWPLVEEIDGQKYSGRGLESKRAAMKQQAEEDENQRLAKIHEQSIARTAELERVAGTPDAVTAWMAGQQLDGLSADQREEMHQVFTREIQAQYYAEGGGGSEQLAADQARRMELIKIGRSVH